LFRFRTGLTRFCVRPEPKSPVAFQPYGQPDSPATADREMRGKRGGQTDRAAGFPVTATEISISRPENPVSRCVFPSRQDTTRRTAEADAATGPAPHDGPSNSWGLRIFAL